MTQLASRKAEWVAGLLITVAAVWLHTVFFLNAGGLWRDEAGVVRVATLPTFQESWSNLANESCPIAFPEFIRFWSAIGAGGADSSLRLYGWITGLLMLGLVWLTGWLLTRRAPLVALGLLGANLTVVRWGDSLRAYGTGSVLILPVVLCVGRYIQEPGWKRWTAAALAAALAVQCLFQNAFLVLGMCGAAAGVAVWRSQRRVALAALAIGLPAALSLLPYAPIIRQERDWAPLLQTGFIPQLIWHNLSDALAPIFSWTKWLWLGLALLAVVWGLGGLRGSGFAKREPAQSTALYAALALLAGTICFFAFLAVLAFPTQPWYYLAWLTYAAACIEVALANWLQRFESWRLVLPLMAFVFLFPSSLGAAGWRMTNLDLVAQELTRRAAPGDLILVNPWYYGVSFDRYYRGTTPWVTLPPLDDHRFHRYDLVKKEMQKEQPIQPVLSRIASTLKSNHQVWLVGKLPLVGLALPAIQPAPNNPWGWFDVPYYDLWGKTAGYYLHDHYVQVGTLDKLTEDAVSPLEDLPIFVFSGWRE